MRKKKILSESYVLYYQFTDADGTAKRGSVTIASDKKDDHGRLAMEHVRQNPSHTILKIVHQ